LISVNYGGECAIQDPGCYLCITADDPAAGCALCAPGFKLATQPLKGRKAALENKAGKASSWEASIWPKLQAGKAKAGEDKAGKDKTGKLQAGQSSKLENSFTVPYCVGSALLGTAENEVVNTFGKLQPAVNKVSEAKLNDLRNVANKFNSTLYGAKNAIENPAIPEAKLKSLREIANKLNSTLSNALRSLGNGANVPLASATAPIQDLLQDPLQKAEEQRSAISSLVTDFAAEDRA
jgi:hypothetical protein